MNSAAYPERYDIRSIADTVVNRDGGFQIKNLRVLEELGDLHFLHHHPDRIFQEACHIVPTLFGSACMNYAAYPEGYDIRSVTDTVINGEGGFHEDLEFGNYFTP